MKLHEISDPDFRRRGFLRAGLVTFGAAGLAGMGGSALAQAPVITGVASGAVVPPSDALDPNDAIDPPKPPGLKRFATVDARFPVSYRRTIPAACRVLTAHFDAIATRSYPALVRTMHFPFGIIERLDGIVVKSPAELTDTQAPFSLNFAPNGSLTSGTPSRLIPGAYDMMKSLEVLNFDPVHVNMAMTFDRYNRHGFRTSRCEGIYCVTNNNGKWAIQMLSTIWKADDHIDLKWPDAEAAAMRLRASHDDSYMNDVDIIDRPRPHRGPRIGISGGGSGNLFGTAATEDQMALFKVRGVTTRMSIGQSAGEPGPTNTASGPLATDPANRRVERPQAPGAPPRVDEPKWASQPRAWQKLGIDNWWEARIAPDARIIHANSDKVHRFAGASRYNAAGERLNISMEVAAVVLGSGGEWVGNGSLRYATVHDRLNDDMT